jgi:hypothetical protein
MMPLNNTPILPTCLQLLSMMPVKLLTPWLTGCECCSHSLGPCHQHLHLGQPYPVMKTVSATLPGTQPNVPLGDCRQLWQQHGGCPVAAQLLPCHLLPQAQVPALEHCLWWAPGSCHCRPAAVDLVGCLACQRLQTCLELLGLAVGRVIQRLFCGCGL